MILQSKIVKDFLSHPIYLVMDCILIAPVNLSFHGSKVRDDTASRLLTEGTQRGHVCWRVSSCWCVAEAATECWGKNKNTVYSLQVGLTQ